MRKIVVTVDGANFSTLEGFFDEFERRALNAKAWGRNLDAFNDVLRGGSGTPPGGFVLVWRHHALSRHRLGYAETTRQLRRMLVTGDPHNELDTRRDIAGAASHRGSTVYDWLLDIIRAHGPGGAEADDRVELLLR
jgi:RNAse (barnase) inhibitor barstar